MPDPGWYEVRIVLRTSRERIDQAQAWLEDMGLAEINRIDVIELDDDLRRWDGARPPGTVVAERDHDGITAREFFDRNPELLAEVEEHVPSLTHLGMPEPCVPTMDRLDRPTQHPVFDRLRQGLHLHEQ